MKWILVGIFCALVAWSFVAWWMIPDPAGEGREVLTWVSDDNPVRRLHTIAPFEALNPDIKVVLDPSNTTVEKIIVQCKAGVGPDVFNCFGHWQLIDFVKTGVLLPLDDYASAGGFGLDATWPRIIDEISFEDFNPATGRNERHQYLFPLNVNANVMFFDKSAFDEIGEPYPSSDWDWNECLRVANKLVKRDENDRIVRYGLGTYEMLDTAGLVWQFGGEFFDPTLTYCTLDSPEALEAITFLHRMLVIDKVMPTVAERDAMNVAGGYGSPLMDLFCRGRIAMLRIGRWALVTFRKEKRLHGRLGAVLLPHMRGDADEIRALGVGINPQSPNREAALRFLRFLASEQFSWEVAESADALPPLPRVAADERFLHDPEHPEEDFNHLFAEAMSRGRTLHITPFVPATRVERIFNLHLALMSNGRLTPREMSAGLTDELNGEIRTNLIRYESMREDYQRRTGHPFDPNDFPPKRSRR